MSLLSAAGLACSFAADEIFVDVNVEIARGARIALVGPNGAGKTTLLRVLYGQEAAEAGSVRVAGGTRIGYLPQRPELAGAHSLETEARRGFRELERQAARLAALEAAMEDPQRRKAALAQYGPLQESFERVGGYTRESRLRMVLRGVGFAESDFGRPLTQLSGGEKTRANLARLLLQAPDLLLLDEPTNHLDIEAITWLENWLRSCTGAVLLVSHDRWFMDEFAQQIWELEGGRLSVYRGNYSHYARQRDERRQRLWLEYEAQQERIAKDEAFIRKHMGSRLTAQARGRQKRLATLEKRGLRRERPPGERRRMGLDMGETRRSGDEVLMTRDLVLGYPDDGQPLLRVPNITLRRGEVAALVGPNGVGKSAFLKTITAQLAPLAGSVRLGAAVQAGYFAQAHENLREDRSILDEILERRPLKVSEARDLLGRYLFSGDDVFRPVHTLSGGERGRLALALLALAGANLLLLDEPSNHLDIDSQDVLQQVLEQFGGTVLLVSHDRWLIDALATQLWIASAGEITLYDGSWREYRRAQEASASVPANGAAAPARRRRERAGGQKREQRALELEARIDDLEQRQSRLTAAIEEAGREGQTERVAELGALWAEAEAALETALTEWSALAD
ncbi:MAG: ABC-F family ATP-binding cassette domain-containing protein [Anaerolineaceae bacterium]|nr:ABC-F family ATP-binding cassette domain-containing protein [Anaerolineaceae bacterium]